MVFNDSSNPQNSIVHDILYWTGADTSTYKLSDITRDVNEEYRVVNSLIWQASGEWEFDDSNYSTLPIATANLVDGQDNYTLPTRAQRLLRVEVKDKDGNWHWVEPLDQSDLKKEAYEEFQETDGLPKYFDAVANAIILKPAPAGSQVTTTDGLRVWISRDIKTFNTTTTTRSPGFDVKFHRLLSLRPAYNFLLINEASQPKLDRILGKIREMQEGLIEFYGSRHEFRKSRILPRTLKFPNSSI